MQEHCIKISSKICFGYLLESPHWGDSNRYPKHMFYAEIRIKQGIFNIQFYPLWILYSSKFITMATYLGTNAVVVTRVHCITTNNSGMNLYLIHYMVKYRGREKKQGNFWGSRLDTMICDSSKIYNSPVGFTTDFSLSVVHALFVFFVGPCGCALLICLFFMFVQFVVL